MFGKLATKDISGTITYAKTLCTKKSIQDGSYQSFKGILITNHVFLMGKNLR